MISNKKELFDFIDSILKKEGFVKKKDTWYLTTEECICYFHVGKEAYGVGYFSYVTGCFLKELHKNGEEYPVFYKDDLRYDIGKLVDKDLVQRAFHLADNEFKGEEREFIIKEIIELYVIPFLKDVGSKEGIKNAVDKYDELIHWLKGNLRKKLSLKLRPKKK